MPRDRSLLLGTAAAVVAASLFGTLGPLARFAADRGVDGVAFTAWRAGLGVAALAVVVAARGGPGRIAGSLAALPARGRGALATAALAGLVLNAAMFTAFERIPIALALMLFYTYPAAVAAVDIALGHERATASRIGALGLASTGVVLVLVGGLDLRASPDALGIGLALGAAACQVTFVTVSRHGYRSVPTEVATLMLLAVSAAGGAALAPVVGQGAGLLVPLRTPDPWPILLFAGVLAAGVSSVLFLTAIRRIGGTRTGILMLLEPVVGVVLSGLLLDEALAPVQALGGALVLAGALVLQASSAPALEPVVEEAAGPVL